MAAPALLSLAGRFAAWAERLAARPAHSLAWLIALHALAWWLALAVGQRNLPLDVIEIFNWSLDPGWATHKLPPLTVWLFWLFDRAGFGWQPIAQLQAPLAMAVTLWALWRLGLRVFSPQRALLGLLLLECVGPMTFQAALFNQNAVQIPFWALTALALWRALESDRLLLWIAVGLLAALSLLGKYFGLYLLAALGLFLLLEPGVRWVWRRPGPYLALLVALGALAPHLYSVAVDYRWQPFDYALDRAADARGWSDHLTAPLGWLLAQLASLWSALIAAAAVFLPGGPAALPAAAPRPAARRYLLTLAFAPLALCLLSSAITGARFIDPWGIPLWTFLPLGLLALRPQAISRRGLRNALAGALLFGGGAVLLQLGGLAAPLLLREPPRTLFNGPALAAAAVAAWRAEVPGTAPPAYVVGSYWLAGNVLYYGPWRVSAYVNAIAANSPWVDEGRLRREGGLLVWTAGPDEAQRPPWLRPLLKRLGWPPRGAWREVAIPWRLYGPQTEPYRVRFLVIRPDVPP